MTQQQQVNKKTKGFVLFLGAALAVVILFVCFGIYKVFYSANDNSGAEKKFSIRRGENANEVITKLRDEGIINSETTFKIALKLSGKSSSLLARNYVVPPGLSNMEIIDLLTNPAKRQTVKFTVQEGLTLRQVAELTESKLMLSREKFMKAAENDSLITLLGLKGRVKNLEGFLYPETYVLDLNTSEEEIVSVMYDEFRRRVFSNMEVKQALQGKDLLAVVTLASIVEAETPLDSEKVIVAGVYQNRIDKGMKLEADPTVQYALPQPKQRLLFEDLKVNSPYNTYMYAGLPPGPINSPSLSSIRAALFPQEHAYIYFVATGTGGHKFSRNFEEHQKAVQEYRKIMKK